MWRSNEEMMVVHGFRLSYLQTLPLIKEFCFDNAKLHSEVASGRPRILIEM